MERSAVFPARRITYWIENREGKHCCYNANQEDAINTSQPKTDISLLDLVDVISSFILRSNYTVLITSNMNAQSYQLVRQASSEYAVCEACISETTKF